MSRPIDPAFLSAWRETQGQPVDAEPRREPVRIAHDPEDDYKAAVRAEIEARAAGE